MASGERIDAGELAARISQRVATVDRAAWDAALNGLRNGRFAAALARTHTRRANFSLVLLAAWTPGQ